MLRVTREKETPSHVMVRFSVKDTGIGISEGDRLRAITP
jgi:signal transduction histidine kinase